MSTKADAGLRVSDNSVLVECEEGKSEQIKSADPVTYDDNGNVIPLSERFNPENKDIRYKKRIDGQYDFSLDKDLNNLDDKALKVYNKRGWSYSLFSDEEMVLLREKFDEYA